MEDGQRFTDKAQTKQEILSYLLDHPEAQDTLLGIAEWWLLERNIRHQTEMVMQAISELVQHGLVYEHKSRDSQVHYRLNHERKEEIRTLLDEFGEEQN